MTKESKRFVSVLEAGRKWADIYDTTVPNKHGKPGKLVARVESGMADAVTDSLNS